MPENEQARYFNRIFKWLFFATFAICLPPVILYFYSQFSGSLPAEAVWEKRGGNHGPWWDEPQGALVQYSFLAMLMLPCATSMFALVVGLEAKCRKLVAFGQFLALALLQFIIGYTVFFTIFWTID